MSDGLPPTFVEGFHDEEAVRKMPYSKLGETGMIVSRIGFGAAVAGGIYGDKDDEAVIQTIVESVRRGVNWIDTAPYYGWGKSEEIVGEALKRIPRQAYYISTKACRYTRKGKPDCYFNYSYDRTLKSIDISLKKLGIDYVDLLICHDIEFAESAESYLYGAFKAMKVIQEAGKAKCLGVSSYRLSNLLEACARTTVPLQCILSYARHTLIDPSLKETVGAFKKLGVSILNAQLVGGGLLVGNLEGLAPWHWVRKIPEMMEAVQQAEDYCKAQGVSLCRIALSYSFNECPEDVPLGLVGMPKKEILEFNLNALLEPLNDKEKEALQYLLKMIFGPLKIKNWENFQEFLYPNRDEIFVVEG